MQIFVSPSLNAFLLFPLSIKYMLNDRKSAKFVVLKPKQKLSDFLSFSSSKFAFTQIDFPFIFSQLLFCQDLLHPKYVMFFHLLELFLLC